MKLLAAITKIFARLRGAAGWCGMAYHYNRANFIMDGYWHRPQIPPLAWYQAFMFEWKPL